MGVCIDSAVTRSQLVLCTCAVQALTPLATSAYVYCAPVAAVACRGGRRVYRRGWKLSSSVLIIW